MAADPNIPAEKKETPKSYDKNQHLANMKKSDLFSYCYEMVIHNEEVGSVERVIDLALSQGQVGSCLRYGFTETDLKVAEFKQEIAKYLGANEPLLFSYRVRIAIK